MSVSLRPHPNDQGLPLTEAQRATVLRFRRRHPKLRGHVTRRGLWSGFCTIVLRGFDPDSYPHIDAEGFVVAWRGEGRGWRRIGHPIDPDHQEVATPHV